MLVAGKEVRKSSQEITDETEIVVLEAIEYVSRAGHKLARALDEFAEIEVEIGRASCRERVSSPV